MSAAFEAFRRESQQSSNLTALVLGSGMGSVTGRITPRAAVPFGDVPGLVPPTVAGH
jgi:purine-nucleoside phosphorylase